MVQSVGAGVTSVFGRSGAVVAAANDYAFNQISGTIVNSMVDAAAAIASTKINPAPLTAAITAFVQTDATGDFTTSSGALVDITGMSITRTTAAKPVMIIAVTNVSADTIAEGAITNIVRDGAVRQGLHYVTATVAEKNAQTICDILTETAASHTYKLQGKVPAGTGIATWSFAATNRTTRIIIVEYA